MTVPVIFSLLLLWLAAGVKLAAIGWRSDAATRYFAISALCSATALTARAFDAQVDELIGEPNTYHLIEHLLLLCGGHQVLNFVTALQPDRPITTYRRAWNSWVTLLIFLVWTASTWYFAPLHEQHLPDPITLSDPSFLLYLLPFTVYMVAMMISTAVFALRQGAATIAADPPPPARRTVAASLILIGVGLLVAVIEPISAAVWSLVPSLSPGTGSLLRTGISPLMYGGGALLAIGMVITMLIGSITQLLADRRYIRRLRPLWADLVRRYPQTRLAESKTWSITRRTSLRLVRMQVELLDCLSRLRIDSTRCSIDGDLNISALADAVRQYLHSSTPQAQVPAIDVLTIEPTPDQTPPAELLALADAYNVGRDRVTA